MSEEQRKKFWKLVTESNWEKAQPEISSWEDILEGDFDWEPEPKTAEALDQSFYKERHCDLELLNTIKSERDFGLRAMREAQSFARISELTDTFYDCLSQWETKALELEIHANQSRIENAITRAQSMFAETSRLAQERVGRIQAAHQARAKQKAQERAAQARIAESNRQSREYIWGLQQETRRKAKESRDRQHQLRMASGLGFHSVCPRCLQAKLIGHLYCCHCNLTRLGPGWGY